MSEEFEKKNSRSLPNVITEFVLPNCWLQIHDDMVKKGGMAIPYLLSKPGAGKSTILKDLCSRNDFGLLIIHPALKPIEEWGGLPNFKDIEVNGTKYPGTEWTISEVIVELMELSENTKMTVMLWDDMHLCGQQHLALMQEAFSERSVRGYKIPDNVAMVLAGNDSNKAGHKSLSSAISNRCARCYTHMDYDSWKKNFAIPNGIHPAIITFLGNSTYSHFFHEDEVVDEPWASPRSWTRFSNYLTAMEQWSNKTLEASLVNYYCSAHNGDDAASEFSKYYAVYMKFDVKNILDTSNTFQMPDNELDHYPLAFALLYYFSGLEKEQQKKMIPNLTQIIRVFYDNSKALALLMFKELLHIEQTLKRELVIKIINEAEKNHQEMVSQLIEAVDNLNEEE